MKIILDIIIKKIFHRFSTTHHTQDGSLVVTEATCIIHTVRPVSQEKLTPSWLVLYWHYTTVLWRTIKNTSLYYNQISNQQTTPFTSEELE